MDNLKSYLLKVRQFLEQFKKVEQKKKPPKLKTLTKKQVNLAVVGGIFFLLLIGFMGSIRAITLSNQVSSLKTSIENFEKEKSDTPSTTRQYDYRLQYYLNDFVYAYFTLSQENNKQTEQINHLNSFYGSLPDTKSQGQVRNPSEVIYSQLVTVTDKVATYRVKYKEWIKKDNNTEKKEITTGFNIPFEEVNGKYRIAGLPWFSSLDSSQATPSSKDEQLTLSATDRLSEDEHKKVDKFLTVFFTNYTTNQDNLNLIAKDVSLVANTTFKSIDYTYLKEDGEKLIATVQVTFEVGASTHSENFTLTLIQNNGTYFVDELAHTIPLNYAKQEK